MMYRRNVCACGRTAYPSPPPNVQEYMRREEVIRATATWPPDVEQERRIVSLDASKTAVAALPRPQSGQSKQSLYKSVFHGMQAGAGCAAGGGGQ